MSGSYGDESVDVSGVAAAQIAPALAVVAAAQADAARFISTNGAASNNGHGEVGHAPPHQTG
jgi:hypothetical protein